MKNKAFSLIECMVTLVLLMITIGAVMSFRCYAVTAAQRAKRQLSAAHTAQLLCESWKAQNGDTAFDPLHCSWEPDFAIATYEAQSELPACGGSYATSCTITLKGESFDAHMFYEDDIPANMRTLHVFITWTDDLGSDSLYHLPTMMSI